MGERSPAQQQTPPPAAPAEPADGETPDEQPADRPQDGDPAQPRQAGWNGSTGIRGQ